MCGGEGDREISFIFNPLVPLLNGHKSWGWAGPVPEDSIQISRLGMLGPSSAGFLDMSTGSWVGTGAARTPTAALVDLVLVSQVEA